MPYSSGSKRGIGHHLVDAGVDPGDIGAGAGEDVLRHPRQLGVEVAAEQEQPRRRVMRRELRPERFGQPAQLAPVRQVDLEQPVARDDIALAEKGVGDRLGADVRDAIGIVDDLDRRRQAAAATCRVRDTTPAAGRARRPAAAPGSRPSRAGTSGG